MAPGLSAFAGVTDPLGITRAVENTYRLTALTKPPALTTIQAMEQGTSRDGAAD